MDREEVVELFWDSVPALLAVALALFIVLGSP